MIDKIEISSSDLIRQHTPSLSQSRFKQFKDFYTKEALSFLQPLYIGDL